MSSTLRHHIHKQPNKVLWGKTNAVRAIVGCTAVMTPSMSYAAPVDAGRWPRVPARLFNGVPKTGFLGTAPYAVKFVVNHRESGT